MEYSSERIADAITALSRLPGVGRKTAQRLAFHLLRCPLEEAMRLSTAVARLREDTRLCEECGNIADDRRCLLCADPRRDGGLLCVVEQPADVVALERTGVYLSLIHI